MSIINPIGNYSFFERNPLPKLGDIALFDICTGERGENYQFD
ncbi:hypothetical protein EDWATA_01017 [Edwardsiella tarda ATCC 23685]|uniref:Uncharacterized protein n=1 Tax=Edwardsiella tarda ATCC 23685 TaxID=500638 RepID=D4F2R6_EDWTA|nr:hypothetical protein EDWATA_01017 [Edwardsiella tarda ATCC 23685]